MRDVWMIAADQASLRAAERGRDQTLASLVRVSGPALEAELDVRLGRIAREGQRERREEVVLVLLAGRLGRRFRRVITVILTLFGFGLRSRRGFVRSALEVDVIGRDELDWLRQIPILEQGITLFFDELLLQERSHWRRLLEFDPLPVITRTTNRDDARGSRRRPIRDTGTALRGDHGFGAERLG